MKKKLLTFLLGCLISMNALSIDCLNSRDTLIYSEKKIVLNYSPMHFFGTKSLYLLDSTIVDSNNTGVQCEDKKYIVNYIVIKGKIYVSNVMSEIVSKNIKERFEQLTKRKFNKKGLLRAYWIDGMFLGRVDAQPYPLDLPYYSSNRDFIPGIGELYRLTIRKGKLIRIEDISDTENEKGLEYKRWLENYNKILHKNEQ